MFSKKTEKVQTHLTETEKQALEAEALREGMKLSQLVAKIVRNYLQVMGYRLLDCKPKTKDSCDSQELAKKPTQKYKPLYMI